MAYLFLVLVSDAKIDRQLRIDRNSDLINFLNEKFNFCFNSEIEIGDNALRCNHPLRPYEITCINNDCNFEYMGLGNESIP